MFCDNYINIFYTLCNNSRTEKDKFIIVIDRKTEKDWSTDIIFNKKNIKMVIQQYLLREKSILL